MQYIDTRLLVETTQSSTIPKKTIYLLRAKTSPKIVRWTFLLFIFTIPFEPIDLGAISGAASLSRLAGLFFFSSCLVYPKVCFRRPPQALWWFAGYVSVFGLSGVFLPEQFVDAFTVRCLTFIQLLVFCWIGSTLLQEEKFARYVLLAFSIAILLSGTGMLLGVPGFSETSKGRMTVSGFNADGCGLMMALGAHVLIWLGFGLDPTLRNIWIRVTFLALSLLPLTAMVYTGTRGAIIAFLAGVAVYVLPYCGSKRKMAAVLGATITVVCVVYLVFNNENALPRFEKTYNTGDLSGRDRIYAAAIEMISEKPLLGWRPFMVMYEHGQRIGKRHMDAHNIFLYLLTEVGLLGTMPFLIGTGLCMRASWTARVSNLGLFPLVWLTTLIVDLMFGTGITSKILWFILTFSLASGASTIKQYRRKNFIVRTILQDFL
jgi:O-antigen ligase